MGRRAKFFHHAVAHSLGIALTCLRERHDLVCNCFVGEIAAIIKSSPSPNSRRLLPQSRRVRSISNF
jgi:hypothetical protein